MVEKGSDFKATDIFFKFIYLFWEREKEREGRWASRGGTERWIERIPSRLCSVSTEPNSGLEPMKP